MSHSKDRESLLARYMEGPELLERSLAGLPDDALDTCPPGGGWTIRQIVHHIADGDDLWKMGLKAAMGNVNRDFTFDWYWEQPQDVWAERWAYARRPLGESLALLRASRAHVRQLLQQVPDGWDRSIGIRKLEGGTERLSVRAVVEMQADHLEHHVDRIRTLNRERDGC